MTFFSERELGRAFKLELEKQKFIVFDFELREIALMPTISNSFFIDLMAFSAIPIPEIPICTKQ